MIRSSNDRGEIIARLSRLIPEAQNETQAVDGAAAARLGVNLTDLRCVGVLFAEGPLSAGALASTVGLTRGAMTTALDRLERARLVRRGPAENDRRAVIVEMTPAATEAVGAIWGPIGRDGLRSLEGYSDNELNVLVRFFEGYGELQRRHAERIRTATIPGLKSPRGKRRSAREG